MKLTEQQLRFFHTFGYLLMPKLFSQSEIADITEGFETSIRQFAGGDQHDGSKHTLLLGPIERLPAMCALLDDPRLLGLIGGVIGDDFNYSCGDGNYYIADSRWHADGHWGELFAVKVAFYLDPVRRDSGALRVVPGSQDPSHFIRRGKLDMWGGIESQFGVAPKDFPGNVALESDPGDVVIFNHDTYHSAWGGSKRRRMFTMNCTRRGTEERTFGMVRQYLAKHSPGGHKMDTGNGMYYLPMMETATPARMAHLEQAAAIHDELFPHLARRLAAAAKLS
jgi:Phytanoyl-CoA dioxygenase (PhyH)